MNSWVQCAAWGLTAWALWGATRPTEALAIGRSKTIDVRLAGRDVGLRVEMALADAHGIVDAPGDPIRWNEEHAIALGTSIAAGLRIERDGEVCPLRAAPAEIAAGTDGTRVVVRLDARCPGTSAVTTLLDGTLGHADATRVRIGETVVRLDVHEPRATLRPEPTTQASLAEPQPRRSLPAFAWPWAVPGLAAAAWVVLRLCRRC